MRIKSLSGKINEDKIKKDLEEIETIDIELDHRVSKLIAENEHLKQTYKQLYDSIKPARIRSKEQFDDLINQVNLKSVEISDLNASLQEKVLEITALKDDLKKLKGKAIVDNAVTKHTIDPEMLKIDVAFDLLRDALSATFGLSELKSQGFSEPAVKMYFAGIINRSFEPFETDESAATPPPHPAYRMTARITIPEPLPVPAWSNSEVARLLAISSLPASPLSPWSSSPPQISFPLSPPSPVLTAPPPSPIRSLGYRAATIWMRAEAAATSHSLPLPPPFILSPTRPDAPPPMPTSAPTSLPPLLLPSASRGEDRPEVNLPPRERLGIALGPSYEVGESSAAAAARPAGGLRADYGFVATMDREIRRDPERYVGYGITDSWDEIVETLQGAPVSTDTELGAHVRDFESMVRRDTDEIYTMLDDEQSQRQLLASRVNMLFRDRRAHAHTRLLMETEARMSREAWGKSMDASDLARAEVMSLRTTVHAQMSEITELQSADHSRRRAISDLLETDRGRREEMRELRAADRTRQQQIIQTLTVMQTLQREMIPLQGLVTTLQGQVTALQGQVMTLQGQVTALQGQQGPAGGPA
ncbi:hypothetical protein Tco_1429080 [Tanacetum coccineum]